MIDLRAAVEGLRVPDSTNNDAQAYAFGANDVVAAVLALIPDGALLFTETTLAEALADMAHANRAATAIQRRDAGDYMRGLPTVAAFAAAILARLRGPS